MLFLDVVWAYLREWNVLFLFVFRIPMKLHDFAVLSLAGMEVLC